MLKRAFSRVSKIVNMDVSIISRDTIKPDSSSLKHLQPYKLSLFDQLIPTTYVPKLFFYHKFTDHHCNATETPARLKRSFEEAISLYYPFSGRIKNNLCIDDFHTGVPYLEARVKGSMLEFLMLQEQETELLNCLVPFRPFRNEVDYACDENVRASNLEPVHKEGLPMIAVQVNHFSCGGIAIGVSTSHKIFDGQTTSAFLTTWAAICRESHESIVHPNLSESASITFPPRDSLPRRYLQLMERIWFHESDQSFVTRRFMFDAKSIASLQAISKSELVVKPSRVEALTCFLWKHYEKAMKDSPPKASIVAHAVNMRPRMNPQMPANIIGNLFWWAKAIATAPAGDHELCDLVKMLNTSLRGFNSDYLKTLQGEDGFAVIAGSFDQLEAMFSMKSAPKFYAFSSWSGIPKQLDFGWGRPFWIGVSGKTGSPITLLVPRPGDDGIEAWVTLNEKQMDILEKDAEFLEFASPNSCINTKSM